MDTERETLHNRLSNKHRSHASEIAWKRHHGSYMRGSRKRSRNCVQSIYTDNDIDKLDKDESMNINELNKQFKEATEEKDNIFELKQILSFENMAGGVALSVDDDTNYVNITTCLENKGVGSYKSSVELDASGLEQLYNEFKDELQQLCNNFDNELLQLLKKHGLKPTK